MTRGRWEPASCLELETQARPHTAGILAVHRRMHCHLGAYRRCLRAHARARLRMRACLRAWHGSIIGQVYYATRFTGSTNSPKGLYFDAHQHHNEIWPTSSLRTVFCFYVYFQCRATCGARVFQIALCFMTPCNSYVGHCCHLQIPATH